MPVTPFNQFTCETCGETTLLPSSVDKKLTPFPDGWTAWWKAEVMSQSEYPPFFVLCADCTRKAFPHLGEENP